MKELVSKIWDMPADKLLLDIGIACGVLIGIVILISLVVFLSARR